MRPPRLIVTSSKHVPPTATFHTYVVLLVTGKGRFPCNKLVSSFFATAACKQLAYNAMHCCWTVRLGGLLPYLFHLVDKLSY